MAFVDEALALDAHLAAHGFPALSDWWREEFCSFYESGARVWGAQVGRGGAKSTTLAKLALFETLLGDFDVPPGERHYFVFCSARAEEAKARLRLIDSYLAALEIPHRRSGDVITLDALPRGFHVLPATVGSVSGHRALGFAGDEVAKWRSDKDSANPAAEIAASARAMTVTHKSARMAFFSSPLARDGFHFDLIQRGNDAHQFVSRAPTWVANPTISEDETRALEPDPRVWSREYLAEPQDAALAAFESELIDRAMNPRDDLGRAHGRVCVLDPSRGGGDAFAYGFLGWNTMPDGRRVLVVDAIKAFEGRRKNLEGVIGAIAAECRRRNVSHVYSDQGGDGLVPGAFRKQGLVYREFGWSPQTKPRAVETLRRLLIDEMIALPPDAKLRSELLAFEERITSSGQLTYGGRGAHDDRVAVLVTAMFVEISAKLVGSPSRPKDPKPRGGGHLMSAGEPPHPIDRLEMRCRRSRGISQPRGRMAATGGGF